MKYFCNFLYFVINYHHVLIYIFLLDFTATLIYITELIIRVYYRDVDHNQIIIDVHYSVIHHFS